MIFWSLWLSSLLNRCMLAIDCAITWSYWSSGVSLRHFVMRNGVKPLQPGTFLRIFFASLDSVERNGASTCWAGTFIPGVDQIISLVVVVWDMDYFYCCQFSQAVLEVVVSPNGRSCAIKYLSRNLSWLTIAAGCRIRNKTNTKLFTRHWNTSYSLYS